MNFAAFLIINIVAGVICLVRTSRRTNLYYAGYLTAMSLSLLGSTLDPNPARDVVHSIFVYEVIARFLASLSYNFSPYFLLLFGFSMLPTATGEKRLKVGLFALVPIMAYYIYGLFNAEQSFMHIYPGYSGIFPFIGIWGSAYVLSANVLVIYSLLIEKDSRVRLQKMLIAIITLPTLLIAYIAYVEQAFKPKEFLPSIATLCLFVAIGAVCFAIRFGFMGVRLFIEKDYLNDSIKSMTMGISMLNHSIKNELQVIDSSVVNIQRSLALSGDGEERLNKSLTAIQHSVQHLTDIVSGIHHYTQDLSMEFKKHNLRDLIVQAIHMEKFWLEDRKILVETKYLINPVIYCDAVHVRETLKNIIRNAVEAIKSEGRISIELYQQGKTIKVKITDSGEGVSKERLTHILEPFYTTKMTGDNYGLGLSYCYRVMQLHKGTIGIESVEGHGTTIILSFPQKAAALNG